MESSGQEGSEIRERIPTGQTIMMLESAFASRLKPKLDAIEKVRSDLTVEKIEVPGVVVIGDQSAGKSSVLESISGINFPPARTLARGARVSCAWSATCNSSIHLR